MACLCDFAFCILHFDFCLGPFPRVFVLIYLASTSPRRRHLLCSLGIRFRLVKPTCDESVADSRTNPRRYAIASARSKALSATTRVRSGIIIGVDTVVVLGAGLLGKPETRNQARRMLEMLSGKTHLVVSGVAVVRMPQKQVFTSAETTRVLFRALAKQEIERYLATCEPYDKAGAYAIQGYAGAFVRRVNGCYLNVVGLPMYRLLTLLEKAGYQL